MKLTLAPNHRIQFFSIFLLTTLLSGCGSGIGGNGGGSGSDLPVTMDLSGTSIGISSASVSWTAASAVTHYYLYMNGIHFSTSYPSDGLSANLTALAPNTRYCFKVYAAMFPVGATSQSNELCLTTLPSVKPSVPTNLTAVAVSPGQIDLAWSPSTGDFSGYKVYRDDVYLASTPMVPYSDTTARSSTKYCYSLSAYDPWGYESPRSAPACVVTPSDTIAPSVPINVKAVYDPLSAANPTINLSWDTATDNSGTVASYKIYRNNSPATQVDTPLYSDTDRDQNTGYCYTVTALDYANNESAPSAQACATTSWKLVTVNSNVSARWTAIASDAGNRLHIAYYDGRYTGANQQSGTVNYATNLSGTWQSVVIDSVAPLVYGSISLLINYDGSVHTAYYDYYNYHLKHGTKTAGGWLTESIQADALGVTTVAMVHDAANHLHLVYNPMGSVTYLTNAAGAWTTEVIGNNAVIYGTALTSAIAVEPSGKACVGYYDYANRVLKFVSNASGAWLTETVDDLADVGPHTAIGVDAGGKAHLSYYDVTNGNLKYATNATGSWVVATVDSAGDVGLYTAIALDASGHAHISYTDATNHALKYATNTSGSWRTYTIDSSTFVDDGYTAITIDSTGKIHISYRGNTWLRYATNS